MGCMIQPDLICYKQLYVNENKKREYVETNLENKNREIEALKKILEDKEKETNVTKKILEDKDKEIEELKKILEDNNKEIDVTKKILEDHNKEIEKLKNNIQEKNKELEYLNKNKGSKCSINGSNYEKMIYNIIKNCNINNKPFNTQKEQELAGSSSKNDIECNFIQEKDIGIEVKKYNTPDWMQCSIKYNKTNKKWEATKKGKIPNSCREIFNKLINNINLYDGEVPPFVENSITHEDWVKIKKETNKWDDKYIDIPLDSISNLYKAKGCKYIQISDGYGLYHLGNNICEFDVPLFNIEQQIRIRTKIHTRKNKKGFCNLSVTVACQPKNIKKLIPSKYSLDNKDKLPLSLIYNINQ